MSLGFDLGNIATTEFGVGCQSGGIRSFSRVPIDHSVESALREIAAATLSAMEALAAEPPRYDPSEKYEGTEYVYLPLMDDLAGELRPLHRARNLPWDAGVLREAGDIFCYLALMTDAQGRHLTAIKRATRFKGVLKERRLLRMVTDSLELVGDQVFKLDEEFDLLVDDEGVHILRPNGFESLGKLREAVMAAVPQVVSDLERSLPFVNFSGIEAFAGRHPRAARYLASIRSQGESENIDRGALEELCRETGVEIQEENGRITIPESHVINFLQVLERRRYTVRLVRGAPELFRADSRRKIET